MICSVLASSRSSTMLSTSNSNKKSSQHCVRKDSPNSTSLGHNRATRLSSPPCLPHQKEPIPPNSHGYLDTTLSRPSHPTEHLTQKPSVTATHSSASKKPSLSSSSSFSTSSTASCSSYLTLSSSTTHRSAKSFARLEKPYYQNITSVKRPKRGSRVRFITMITVQETFASHEYDRASDPYAVCTRLTPSLAQQIKDELNIFKLEEMKVHRLSRCHTQFFL